MTEENEGKPGKDAQVGPVLRTGAVADAVLTALRQLNPGMEVLDRGSYARVSAPGRCVLTREAVERLLGRPFRFPGEVEMIMPAYRGRMRMGEDEIEWRQAEP